MTSKSTKTNNSISSNQCTAILFPNLRMNPSSKILLNITKHLKQHQIDAYTIPNDIIQNNIINFKHLETDEEFMQRLVNEVSQILSEINPEQRRHIILIGISAGARFMTAYALAHKLGLAPDVGSFSIPGFLSFNVTTSLRLSKPTPDKISQLQNINQMDYNTNLSHMKDSLIYDIYVDRDSVSAETAPARAERYKKQGLNYKQHCIPCCDYTKDTYYEKKGEDYYLYTEVSAHSLKNGYLMKDDESFECVDKLHGESATPVEKIIDQFLVETGVIKLQ